MNLRLEFIKDINNIAEFCVRNPKYCSSNKDVLCKKVLKANGYKVGNVFNKDFDKEFKNIYCVLLKEIDKIINENNDSENDIKFGNYKDHRNDKDNKIDKTKVLIDYCNNNLDCSLKLRKFLEMNGVELNTIQNIKEKKQGNIFFDFSSNVKNKKIVNDRTTVKMSKGGALLRKKLKKKTKK